MVRNELDWRSMGQHKVDGVQDRILEVAPTCVVEPRRVALGGQESAAATAIALEKLGECDLIIDATADPRAFNFARLPLWRRRNRCFGRKSSPEASAA